MFAGEVHVGGQEHFYMETQRVLVIPKAEDRELDIYVSSQDPAHVQVRLWGILLPLETPAGLRWATKFQTSAKQLRLQILGWFLFCLSGFSGLVKLRKEY